MASLIRPIWLRIDRVLRQNVPEAARTLALPAWDWDIEGLETAIGLKLPEDFQESLRTHDGQTDPNGLLQIFGNGGLLGTKSIQEVWGSNEKPGIWRSLRYPNRPKRGWFPFARGSDCWHCIALDPNDPQKVAEVRAVFHDNRPHNVVALSYRDWLENIAWRLEAREFYVAGRALFFLDLSDEPGGGSKKWR
jgi:cell wall assembly regulator SMI1